MANNTKRLLPILSVLAITLCLFGLDLSWRINDTTPAHWDMARHLSNSLDYKELFAGRHLRTFLAGYYYYPPFYYWITLPFVWLFGWSVVSATAANLVFMLVLAFSAFFIGKKLFNERLGILAAFLVLTLPMLSAQFKEYQLDAPMSALALAGIAALYYSEEFQNRKYSLVFGLIFGLGMLTKWTYFIFVLPPAAFIGLFVLVGKERAKVWLNMIIATLSALILILPWYWHNQAQLRHDFTQGGITSAILEGDPVGLTWPAFAWYFWSFLDNHLWLIGMMLVAISFVLCLVRADLRKKMAIILISVTIGYLAMFKLDNKDARYIMPVVAELPILIIALISIFPARAQKAAAGILVAIGLFTFTETTFGWPAKHSLTYKLNDKHVLTLFSAGSYTIHPPRHQDWRFEEIFALAQADITDDNTVQLLGRDSIEFNRWDLAYLSKVYGLRWVGENLAVVNYRYLIIRAAIPADLQNEEEKIHNLGYTLSQMGQWQLPDASQAYLFKVVEKNPKDDR